MQVHFNLILTTLILLTVSIADLSAQQGKSCGHDHMQRGLFDGQEDYEKAKSDIIKGAYPKYSAQAGKKNNSVLSIPVVFHVIHSGEDLGEGSNIPDGRVQAQLDVLNADFSATNPNFSDATRPEWDAVKGNPLISFCRATIDPDGASTTGIVRHHIAITGPDANNNNIEAVKDSIGWDSNDYMNVFVLSIPGTDASGGVVGYAYLPFFGTVGRALDGIVVDYNWFGGNGYVQSGDKTLSHEVGHYLGLLHTFDGSSCSSDDGMSDTPNVSDYAALDMPTLSCGNAMNPYPAGPQSCGNENMYVNYMDYVNDENCITSFTVEQIAVMRGVLLGTVSGYASRSQLVNNTSTACAGSTPCDLAATMAHTVPSCAGNNDGTATVIPSAGTAPYTYSWSTMPSQSTATASGLTAGIYYVTTTDAQGCSIVNSLVIADGSATSDFGITESHSDVSCNGGNDGSIDINVSVSGSYTYGWSSGQSTQDINGLESGTYALTVTNASGCTQFVQVAIANPPAIGVTTVSTSDVSCFDGSDGAIDVSVNGGIAPYTYLWSGGLMTQDINGLTQGSYSLTVTDNNGCSAVHSASIMQPIELSLNVSATDITTAGGSDGSATASASGGVAPYTYTWSNGGSTVSISNLSPGTYTVTVTDVNGCTIIDSDMVGGFADPCDDNRPDAPNATSASMMACEGVHIPPFVATAPSGAVVDWYDAAVGGNLLSAGSDTYQLVSPLAGSVSLYAESRGTDGCVSAARTEVNLVITSISFELNGGILDCAGDVAELSIEHTSGAAPYTYAWSTGAASATLSVSAGGTYAVTIQDDHGCSASESVVIADAPAVIGIAFTTYAESVNNGNDGRVETTISGGTAGYTYLWSNGATTPNIDNLAPGNYSVTVTDANGCTQTGSITVEAFSCTALQVTLTAEHVSCFGGADGVISAVSSGKEPFTYNWSNGMSTQDVTDIAAGTYSLSVVDSNGCVGSSSVSISQPEAIIIGIEQSDESALGANDGWVTSTVTGGTLPYAYEWSDGVTQASRTDLAPGAYSLLVRDNNSCSSEVIVTIEAFVCPDIEIAPTVQHVGCSGNSSGAIVLNVLEIVAPYTVNWSNGSTTDDISGLSMGNYSVTLTGSDGCELLRTFTLGERPPLTASTSSTDETSNEANDGSASVTVMTGSEPFVYQWSNGATSAAIGSLSPGAYTVVVTDANGCVFEDTVQIGAYICPPFELVNINKTDNVCAGDAGGVLGATISGGTAPYSFAWSNGAISAVIEDLVAGEYTLTVTDDMNCRVEGSETIMDPEAIQVTPTVINASDIDLSDGSIALALQGGSGTLMILWSNGVNTAILNNLAAGTYTYVVTDENGCTVEDSIVIEEDGCPTFELSLTVYNNACEDGDVGGIDVEVTGGLEPYAYSVNGVFYNTSSIRGLVSGSYEFVATDANGCLLSTNFEVESPMSMSVMEVTTEDASGILPGSATVVVVGGSEPYGYQWPDGRTGVTNNALFAGIHEVTITDEVGCELIQEVIVNKTEDLNAIEGLELFEANPNPASDMVNIQTVFSTTKDIRIVITSATGSPVYEARSNAEMFNENIDVSGFAKGLYSIHIYSANEVITRPLAIF